MTGDVPVVVVLAERSALVGELLEKGLTRVGHDVVARTDDGEAALRLAREHPGCVLVISSQLCVAEVLTGFASTLAVGSRIVCLCAQGDTRLIAPILLAGSSGYLFQTDATLEDLSDAITAVAAGQAALHPVAALAVLDQWRATRTGAPDQPAAASRSHRSLTVRERDILAAMSTGMSTRMIARSLDMALKTVEAHKSRVFAKLGARNQAQAVTIARELGLLDAPPS